MISKVRQLLLGITTRAEVTPFLWIGWAWDETPLHLKFGYVSELLRPLARFWWHDATAPGATTQWRLITYEEYCRRKLGQKVVGGVLQVMALEGHVSWPSWELPNGGDEEFLCINHENLRFAPRLLPTNDSTTVCQSLHDACPELQWDKLMPLIRSGKVRLLILSMTADLDGANVRTKQYFASKAKASNEETRRIGRGAYVLLIDTACMSHITNSFTTHAFKSTQLVPKLHAVCYTLNDVKRWASIMRGLQLVIRKDLEFGLYRNQRPDARHREHARQILELTVLRYRHTRARLEVELAADASDMDSEVDTLVEALLDQSCL
jgi:hypothetical protein